MLTFLNKTPSLKHAHKDNKGIKKKKNEIDFQWKEIWLKVCWVLYSTEHTYINKVRKCLLFKGVINPPKYKLTNNNNNDSLVIT